MALKGCECRLRLKQLVAPVEDIQPAVVLDEKPKNRYKGILQIIDGEIVGHYKSLREAAKQNRNRYEPHI